jgi:signal transduction histidine kinase
MLIPSPAGAESSSRVGKQLLTRPAPRDHIVQFYEDEGFLYEVVADYLGAGIAAGEPLIAIATEPHRQGFGQRLISRGFDLATACETGQLTFADARETLSKFMVGGMPDSELLKETAEAVIRKSQARNCHARMRVYGEMVDVLWQEGYPQAAIRLEELWNELLPSHSLSILCTYALGNFARGEHARPFLHVCRTHSHVIPTEDYSQIGDSDTRLRHVSLLQQRARALESEIEQRKQVENALREALTARDDFLSIAGHELRTPLTALQLQLQCIMGMSAERVEAPVRDRLRKIERQVARLSTLIDEFLDVSRIRAGRLALEVEEFDLAALVRETVFRAAESMVRSECRSRVLAEGPVTGTWDRVRIEHVIANLLSNAMKYGRGNPIDVTVSRAANRARLVVQDRGIGISLEDQARIFDRFERACSARDFGGLGLGLWITKRIVEAHQGTIRVESELGKGATFVVELPCAS